MAETRYWGRPVLDWRRWAESEEGERCRDYKTLSEGEYLDNRLRKAFEAGRQAAKNAEEIGTRGRFIETEPGIYYFDGERCAL